MAAPLCGYCKVEKVQIACPLCKSVTPIGRCLMCDGGGYLWHCPSMMHFLNKPRRLVKKAAS